MFAIEVMQFRRFLVQNHDVPDDGRWDTVLLCEELPKSDIVFDDGKDPVDKARALVSKYLHSASRFEINVSHSSRTTVLDTVNGPSQSVSNLFACFNPAIEEVMALLRYSSLRMR